jgi:uncharacterized protein
VEKAICADPALAAADRQMADLYRLRLTAAGDGAASLRQEQQAWLRRRGACETHAEGAPALRGCIEAALAERVAALRPPPAAPPAPAPAAARPAAAFVYGPWQVTADAAGCAVARAGPRGRRFAIERPRAAPAGFPGSATFHPGPGDDGLVQAGDRVVLIADQQRLAAIVRDGTVVGAPGDEAAAARALGTARTLAVVRMLDTLIEVPLDGLEPAWREMLGRCGG